MRNRYITEPGDESVGRSVGSIAIIIAIALVVIAVLAFATMPIYTGKVETGKVGLVYEGGPIEGKGKYLDTVEGGTGRFVKGAFNSVYKYPTTKRSFIMSADKDESDGGKADWINAPSKDGLQASYEVAVYFTLNPKTLRTFHEDQGLKFEAWDDEGWNRMLQQTFKQQITAVVQSESRKHNIVDIYSSADVRDQIEANVRKALKARINSSFGEDYFCGVNRNTCDDFGFVIKQVTIPEGTQKALAENRNSEIKVETERNKVEQEKEKAKAIAATQRVIESCGQSCLLKLAIEKGSIDFWVLPSGQGTNLTLPAR